MVHAHFRVGLVCLILSIEVYRLIHSINFKIIQMIGNGTKSWSQTRHWCLFVIIVVTITSSSLSPSSSTAVFYEQLTSTYIQGQCVNKLKRFYVFSRKPFHIFTANLDSNGSIRQVVWNPLRQRHMWYNFLLIWFLWLQEKYTWRQYCKSHFSTT